jgi:hypothetical protein
MIDINTLASAWKGHRTFANWLVQTLKPETIVDLGIDYGFSMFSLAESNIGQVYGIDSFAGDIHTGIHPDAYDTVIKVINENQYTNINIIVGEFDNIAGVWDKPIDILHIDGLHTYEAVNNDIAVWTKFFRNNNSVMLMHDTISFPEVKQCYDNLPLPKFNFTHSAGLGVISPNKDIIDNVILFAEQYYTQGE